MKNTENKKRFFSDDSYWNQPIPSDAETDPDSEKYVELLANGDGTSPFHLNMHTFTIPVYEVDENIVEKGDRGWYSQQVENK